MQLDNTRIAVRERGILDLLDLSLQVTRAYISPLLLIFVLCVTPVMVLNHLLIGWMADIPYGEELGDEDVIMITRYVTNMTMLITIEAPLITALIAAFLGKVVFLEKPSLYALLKECVTMLPQVTVCQIFVRGVAAAWFLLAIVPRYSQYTFSEFMLCVVAVAVMLLRGFRPFLMEIILLERNPLFGKKNEETMTIGRRSQMLHGPSAGDIAMRSLICLLVSILLFFSVFGTFIFFSGVLFAEWVPGAWMTKVGFPLALWVVAAFMTVVRFLNYLDLRIRQEGWEVELQLRAEAARLAGKFA